MRQFILALGLTAATGVEAQSIDQGTLVIKLGGKEVGREEFTLRAGRAGGAQGTTLATKGRFPSVSPGFVQEATLERRDDGGFISIQLTRQEGRTTHRVIAEVTPRNVFRIHASSSAGSEEVREYPAVPRLVALADSSYGLFAAVVPFATPEGATITAVYPESGRRVTFTARRSSGDGGPGSSIVMSGEINGTIWVDGSNQILRLEFPSSGLEAVRLRRQ